MEEILALQRELAAVQLEGVLNKLSDANTIEIVDKLQTLGLIEQGLIFTISGKEYLTQHQLLEEIEDQILTRAGRLNIIDIPDALDVDLHHIQAALPQVLERAGSTLRLVRGEILADYHLDSLAQEINDTLNSSLKQGILYLPDIATKFNLPMSLVQSLLAAHVGSTIIGRMDRLPDGRLALFGDSFVRKTRACAFATLVACATSPVSVQDVATAADIHSNIFMDVARSQIRPPTPTDHTLEKKPIRQISTISGRLVARDTEFVPELFETARQAFLCDGYRRDGYINYSKLIELQIPEPLAPYLTTHFSDGFPAGAANASQVWIAPRFPEEVRAAAAEALEPAADGSPHPSTETWLDVAGMLPPQWTADVVDGLVQRAFGKADPLHAGKKQTGKKKKSAVLQHTAAGKLSDAAIPGGKIIGGRFVISDGLYNRVLAVFQQDAQLKAVALAKAKAAASSVVVSSTNPKHSETDGSSKQSKGKVAKKGRRAAKSAADQPQSSMDPTFLVPPSAEEADQLVREKIPRRIWDSDHLGTAGSDDQFLEELLLTVVPQLEVMYAESEKNALAEYEKLQRQEEDAFYRETAAAVLRLNFADYCIEMTINSTPGLDNATSRACMDHVLRTDVTDLCRRILLRTARQSGTEIPADALEENKWTAMSAASLIKGLPPALKDPCRSLDSAMRGKSAEIGQFLECYDIVQELLDLPERRSLDKRQQLSMLQEVMLENRNAILANSDVATAIEDTAIHVLHKSISLVSGRLRPGLILSLPAGAIPGVWAWVQARIEAHGTGKLDVAGLVPLVDNLRKEVVGILRKRATDGGDEGCNDEGKENLEVCLRELRNAVAGLEQGADA